jgi:hypothetical protein
MDAGASETVGADPARPAIVGSSPFVLARYPHVRAFLIVATRTHSLHK